MNPIHKKQAEDIAVGIYQWLNAEVQSSSQGTNSYLNDFDEIRKLMILGYEHPQNITSKKNESHMDRLPVWWQGFEMLSPGEEGYDYQAARITFAGLVFISGAYRHQSYLQAVNAEDYLKKRSLVLGVNPTKPVADAFAAVVPETSGLEQANVNLESLTELKDKVARIGDMAIKNTYHRLEYGYTTGRSDLDGINAIVEEYQELGKSDSASVKELVAAQRNWLYFLATKIIFDAKVRGGELKAVPFLDATSISKDPKVYYPFNGETPQ